METIRERLAKLELPAIVTIPAHLRGYMNQEGLEGLSALTITAEALRAVRILVPPGTGGHAHSESVAEEVMGPANYYTLCHAKPQIDMLTAGERLQLLDIMGNVYASKGEPVVYIETERALAPLAQPDPAPGERYITRYLADRAATDFFFTQLRYATDNQEHRNLIFDLWQELKAKRYYGARPGCGAVTPESHPIYEEWNPQEYWERHKPADYKPREGTPPIVWSCK